MVADGTIGFIYLPTSDLDLRLLLLFHLAARSLVCAPQVLLAIVHCPIAAQRSISPPPPSATTSSNTALAGGGGGVTRGLGRRAFSDEEGSSQQQLLSGANNDAATPVNGNGNGSKEQQGTTR